MNDDKIRAFVDEPDYGPAPESDKAVRQWLEMHNMNFRHYINGKWQAASDQSFATICPATTEELARVASGTKEDVDAAMDAAKAAFPRWSALSGYRRWKYLYAIARCLHKHARRFEVLESLNNGKPFRESRDIDIPLAIRHFTYHAGWAMRHDREFPEMEPGGVVAQIIPWNYPLLMLAWKIAPAIAVGNTVVIKPAETTPLTALMFAELLEEVGLPPGVVNIVTGDGATGIHMVNHPAPWKIAFTGSTEVGRKIREATAGTGKKLTLELGGKSPFVVFEDADLDSAARGLINAVLGYNAGQVCCAGSRLLVQESIQETFVNKLKREMSNLRIGHPLDKAVDMGPVNSAEQLKRITDLVATGKREGAEIWQPEGRLSHLPGFFHLPTLCTGVEACDTIAREEIFGPVLAVMPFRTPKDAVDLANNTVYGLAATVYSQDIDKAFDFAKKVNAGTVWINTTNRFDASAGFGGNRESGWGREGGSEGIREYLRSPEHHYPPNFAFDPKDYMKLQGRQPEIDRTYRMLIGGKLMRPDGEVSFGYRSPTGELLATLPDANRKDVREAVKAASAAAGWADVPAPDRMKVLYFWAENLAIHRDRFAEILARGQHRSLKSGEAEVDDACEILVHYASLCDKFEGRTHSVPARMLVTALKEPIGIIAIKGPGDQPLLGAVGSIAPAIAMGNTVVYLAGLHSWAAIEMIQVLQNSDIPAGVINILSCGNPDDTAKQSPLWTLATHEGVDAVWFFGEEDGRKAVEALSISNLKRAWAVNPRTLHWSSGENRTVMKFLYESTQVKNIWTPYGV